MNVNLGAQADFLESGSSDLITTTTDAFQQTVVEEAKKALADGKWTKEEQERIKQQAIDAVMKQIPPAVKKSAELAVTSVEWYVSNSIEQGVLWQKESPLNCIEK